MKAAILAIGSELTRGEIANGNAAWLSEQLNARGVDVLEHCVLPDTLEVISAAMQRLAIENDVVICTGGLGPTSDDLTRDAAALALGVELVRDETSVAAIRARFEKFRRQMPEINLRQADFPQGAQVLSNAVGTAPGFAFELAGKRFFALPGVPLEMRPMFTAAVLPYIEEHVGEKIAQHTLRTYGLSESALAEKLANAEKTHANVVFGYRVRFPEIDVIFRAKGSAAGQAQALVNAAVSDARAALGDVIFGEGEDLYAAVLGKDLRDQKLTLAIAESCTGGLIGELVTSVPGSSAYLILDAVTYANAAKTAVLNVPASLIEEQSAVSEAVARAMAEGVLRVAQSDLAIATTGIAGPDGGSAEKPVGTVWFAIARKGAATWTEQRIFPGNRSMIRTLAAYHALAALRRISLHRI